MDATTLIMAAQLAADLSTYRDKAIALTLTPDGIEVVGTYPGWRYVEIVQWQQLEAQPSILSSMIRTMDRELMERWRDDGQPKRKLRNDH